MIIREVLAEEKEQYNNCVHHILQSYEWGIFREATGVRLIRRGIYQNGLNNGFQLTIHPISNTSYTVGYFPRGLTLDAEILKQLKQIGDEYKCIFIKIEPSLGDLFIKNNPQFIASSPILPEQTFFLDLNLSEEELLNKMKDKTRYNIKLAQKHEVEISEKEDSESLEIFIKLAMETAQRQGFFSHPADYYRKLWEILHPHKMAYLLVAKYKNTPLAAIMLFKFKEMLYYPYGGSATIFREKMPNHLLHWEAIKLGKRLGCTTYDMWGAYKNTPTNKDPWFGIYRFKEGFGGKLIQFPKTRDLVFNPRFYQLYKFLDPLRFKLLALKRIIKR